MKDQVLARRQLGLWKRAAVTALLVGSVLNMINQGDAPALDLQPQRGPCFPGPAVLFRRLPLHPRPNSSARA